MTDRQFMEHLAAEAEKLTDEQKAYLLGTMQGIALARGLEAQTHQTHQTDPKSA